MINFELRTAAHILIVALALFTVGQTRAQDDQVFSLPLCGTLPVPTQMHGTAVVRDRLYVFAGETAGWTDKVYSAEIGSDANLGPWRTEVALPERRSYLTNGVEVVNDRIYLVGGYLSPNANSPETSMTKIRDVLWTQVDPEGKISNWRRSQQIPGQAIALAATCSTDKHLIITGGSVGSGGSTQVLVADFGLDGNPINWRTTTPLPMPLWYHAAAMLENRMYVWSGMGQGGKTDVNARVVSCEVKDDGTLGPWVEETAMPQPVYSASACGLNDYLVSVAGRYREAYPTNAIWHTHVVNGKLQPWQMLKTDLDTRVYHALGLDKSRGYVFIVGGRNKSVPGQPGGGHLVDRVQAFRLTQPQSSELNTQVITSGVEGNEIRPGDLRGAIASASKQGKRILAFFYSPEVPACRRFWDMVVQSEQFKKLTPQFDVVAIDITDPDGENNSRSFSIFRVPTLCRLSGTGQLEKKSTGPQSWSDVEELLH